jgi:cysteinyl-tRNA synthetase
VILRYLRYLGYQVTYVQNITDVGHLTDNADAGEDKVEQKARAERVHPMAIAESYTRRYFEDMDALGVLRPDISPRASGHIVEQIEHVKRLLASGHAYEVGGNVYFDVASWASYGKLSGRTVGEMQAGARVEVNAEKRHPADFALWKRAEPGHIMQWPSPWGMGYPGWHLECSVMSQKYLGETFDIHGGGLENQFPHHEDEIAQAEAATGKPFVKYWLHNNMVTVGGQKMGKSLGNFITLKDAFQKWDPMVIRMFILQSHYRSPLDFSDEALAAAKEGHERLFRCLGSVLDQMSSAAPGADSPEAIQARQSARSAFFAAMDDDFNTPVALAALFELARKANKTVQDGNATKGSLFTFAMTMLQTAVMVLGLHKRDFKAEDAGGEALLASLSSADMLEQLRGTEALLKGLAAIYGERNTKAGLSTLAVDVLINLRNDARKAKNFAEADAIRKRLDEIGITLEDGPQGTTWRFK